MLNLFCNPEKQEIEKWQEELKEFLKENNIKLVYSGDMREDVFIERLRAPWQFAELKSDKNITIKVYGDTVLENLPLGKAFLMYRSEKIKKQTGQDRIKHDGSWTAVLHLDENMSCFQHYLNQKNK